MKTKKNIAIICGAFHKELVGRMLSEARLVAEKLHMNIAQESWVPGSYEVPLTLMRVLSLDQVDAAVLLGIIEKGETAHGLVMAQSVFPAIINLQLKFNKPVGIGILGPEILPNMIEPRLLPYARAAVEAAAVMLETNVEAST